MKKRRPINRKTENKAAKVMGDKQGATEFRGRMEDVFRAELGVLLDAHKGHLSILPATPQAGQDEKYFIGLFSQDENYILEQMEKRLNSMGLYPSRYQIKDYLKAVSNVIRSKLAWNEEISAVPYIGKNYYKPAKKRGRKREIKRGKKRPYNYKGKEYPSIRQAALAHPDETSYNTLKSQAYRELEQI